MKKILLSFLALFLLSTSVASAITDESHPNGTSNIQFNTYSDSIPLSLFAGHCPVYQTVCQRAVGKSLCTLREYKAGLNASERSVCLNTANSDETNFIKGRRLNGVATPYQNSITNPLNAGDSIRLMVYAHNNAEECVDGDTACLNRTTAKNASVTINWANLGAIQASIHASNASPNTTSDIFTYLRANNNLALNPIANSAVYRYERTGNTLRIPTLINSTNVSHTYELPEDDSNGDFKASYGHWKVLYLDFDVVAAAPSATIVKSSVPVSGSTVARNSTIDYAVTIQNTGNVPIPNAVVTDVLDLNTTYVSAPLNNKYTLTHTNGTVTAQLNQDFQPGESITINFTVRVNSNTPNGSVIRNTATLNGDNIPPITSNEVIHTVPDGGNNGTIEVEKLAFIDFNGTAINGPLTLNDTFVYRVIARNTTNDDVTGVITLNDNLPTELTFVRFDPNNTVQGTHNTGTVTFSFGQQGQVSLPANTERAFQFEVQINAIPNASTQNTGACTGVQRGILNQVVLNRNFTRVDNDDVCVPVEGSATIVKTAHTSFNGPAVNGPLSVGDNFVYRFVVTNPTSNNITQPLTVTDNLPNELSFVRFNPSNNPQGVENNDTLTFTLPSLNAGASVTFEVEVQIDTFPQDSAINNTGDCTAIQNGILNQVLLSENITRIDNDDVCIEVTSYTMDKQAFDQAGVEIPDNALLQYGQTYEYRITVTNQQPTNLTNLVVTDDLPTEVTFVDQIDPTNGTYDPQNHRLTYNAGTLNANATRIFRFNVQVRPQSEILNATTVVNNATSDVTELASINDSTVHRLPRGETGCTNPNGCGGGGVPSVPTIGRCNVTPNGAFSCQKVTPVETSPGYTEVYIKCLKDKTGAITDLAAKQQATEGERTMCVDLWATENGYRTCDPNSTSLTSPSIADQCDVPLIPNTPNCTLLGNGNISIDKNVWNPALKNNNGDWSNTTCVPAGTDAKYQIKVPVSCPTSANITKATVNLGDFTIPYTSGWTWNKTGVKNVRLVSRSPELSLHADTTKYNGKSTGGLKITHDLTASEINQCQSGTLELIYEYEVDTNLAVDADICQLDSVAYATLKLQTDDGQKTFGIGEKACTGFRAKDIATLGDKARVCIARPFIQARGGSNIGVNISPTSDKEKVFGSDFSKELEKVNDTSKLLPSLQNQLNTGESSSELLTTDESAYGGTALVNFDGIDSVVSKGDRSKYFDQLKLNALSGAKLPVASNTGSKSQVDNTYFINGDVILSGSHNITEPTTVIIESGDLIMSKNFINTGNGAIAFIVQKGDIIIDKNVSQMDGIFLTETGKIKGNTISETQLQVNGGLMGNARELLENRIYIGVDPVNNLEPAVIVRFDLRILEQTPPGLEFFFGQNWTEQ